MVPAVADKSVVGTPSQVWPEREPKETKSRGGEIAEATLKRKPALPGRAIRVSLSGRARKRALGLQSLHSRECARRKKISCARRQSHSIPAHRIPLRKSRDTRSTALHRKVVARSRLKLQCAFRRRSRGRVRQ